MFVFSSLQIGHVLILQSHGVPHLFTCSTNVPQQLRNKSANVPHVFHVVSTCVPHFHKQLHCFTKCSTFFPCLFHKCSTHVPQLFNPSSHPVHRPFGIKVLKSHWFYCFFEKSLSRKNAGTLDSAGPIRRPGEKVGGGVNPPLRTYILLNHL